MAKAVEVDFSGVKSGGGVRVAPGDYVVKVKSATVKASAAGKPMIVWMLSGLNGALKGQEIKHITSLQPQALFNLRNLLLALKVNVAQGKMKIVPENYVGKTCGITVEDGEPYKGNVKSEVQAVWPFSVIDGKVKREALPTGDELEDDETPEDVDSEEGDDEVEVEDDDSM
jgi:hypothetical protein